jgi:hypothetical protein
MMTGRSVVLGLLGTMMHRTITFWYVALIFSIFVIGTFWTVSQSHDRSVTPPADSIPEHLIIHADGFILKD